jgi:8-oxo-dGTP pyrophosphatase MutT (NUDIX family)
MSRRNETIPRLTPEPVLRTAIRVVMLDPQDRILLIELIDRAGGRRWWIMPGGGLEPDETDEHAARREVLEETGLVDFELGPSIWWREHVFTWQGTSYRQQERFYLARVPAFEARATALAPDELEMTGAMRWWSLGELERVSDDLAPRDLRRHLRDLLESGPPDEPLDVGL